MWWRWCQWYLPSGARPPTTTRSRISAHAASACTWSAYHSSRPPIRTRYRRRQSLWMWSEAVLEPTEQCSCLGRHQGAAVFGVSRRVGSPLDPVMSGRLAAVWAAASN